MKDLYFKGHLTNITNNDLQAIPVMFKIFSINSIFLAQELCTKKVFPLFYSQNIEGYKIRINIINELFVIVPDNIKQPIKTSVYGNDLNETLSKYTSFSFNVATEDFSYDEDSQFDEKEYIEEMSSNSYYLKQIKEKYESNKTIYNSFPVAVETLSKYDISNSVESIKDILNTGIDTEEIDEFGYNLSYQDNLCNLIGRDEEIKKIIKILCIRKNSVLLVGEAGCGKTSIVEKLALDIKNGDNKWLKGKTIFYVNAAALESGTKYRGDFEEKILKLIDFAREHKNNLILFVDEVHSLYGLGRSDESSTDAMNILKPYISRGDITIIGATTNEEYEKYMTSDQAFLRRLEKMDIELPSKEMMMDILLAYIDELEETYSIKLELDPNKRKELINKIIELTDSKHQRIIGDVKTTNPTLAKYILADSFAEAIYNEKDIVTINDICVSITTCSKITPTTRKRIAEEIKEEFTPYIYIDKDKTKVIKFEPQKKLSTIS